MIYKVMVQRAGNQVQVRADISLSSSDVDENLPCSAFAGSNNDKTGSTEPCHIRGLRHIGSSSIGRRICFKGLHLFGPRHYVVTCVARTPFVCCVASVALAVPERWSNASFVHEIVRAIYCTEEFFWDDPCILSGRDLVETGEGNHVLDPFEILKAVEKDDE